MQLLIPFAELRDYQFVVQNGFLQGLLGFVGLTNLAQQEVVLFLQVAVFVLQDLQQVLRYGGFPRGIVSGVPYTLQVALCQ